MSPDNERRPGAGAPHEGSGAGGRAYIRILVGQRAVGNPSPADENTAPRCTQIPTAQLGQPRHPNWDRRQEIRQLMRQLGLRAHNIRKRLRTYGARRVAKLSEPSAQLLLGKLRMAATTTWAREQSKRPTRKAGTRSPYLEPPKLA